MRSFFGGGRLFLGLIAVVIVVFETTISTSNGAVVDVTPKETITVTGEDFIISCQVISDDANTTETKIVWWKVATDGSEQEIIPSDRFYYLPGNNPKKKLTLGFRDVRKDDEGTYKCSFGEDSVISPVRILHKVDFGNTSTNQHPVAGQDAVIRCWINPESSAIVSWSRNNIPLGNNGRYSVIDGNLAMKSFDKDKDDGIYKCEAYQEENGKIVALPINVTAYVPPGPMITNLEGDWPNGVHEDAASVRITCTSSGVPEPTVKWIRNGAELSSSDHYNIPEMGVLEILNVTHSDAGEYRCEATNILGRNKTDFILHIYLKPRVTQFVSNENQTVTFGEDFTAPCKFDGGGPLKATWTFRDEPIDERSPDDEPDFEKENERYAIIGGTSAQLHVRSAVLDDSGEYKCTIENDAGSITNGFVLQVQKAPEITKPTMEGTKIRAVLGRNYTIVCEASGVPSPTFEWSKKDGGDVSIANEEGHLDIEMGEMRTSLTVTTVTNDDFGTYTCTASNVVEPKAHVDVELIKMEVPDAPAVSCVENASAPSSITILSETFSASQPEPKQPALVFVLLNSITDSSSGEQASISLSLNTSTDGVYKITKLHPQQQYLLNVSGENEAGISNWTLLQCNTTAPRAPGKPTFTQEDDALYCFPEECSLEWTVEDDGGRDITQYLIRYFAIPTTVGDEDSESESDSVKELSTSDSRMALSFLEPRTEYRVLVRAVNAEGAGDDAKIRVIVKERAGGSDDDVNGAVGYSSGPSIGAIIGIVVILVLIVVVLIDVACYYVNGCGLLMCICVNLCGKAPPEGKVEVIAEEGAAPKDARLNEKQEKLSLENEQAVPPPAAAVGRIELDATESTPMINVEKPKETSDVAM